MADAARYVGQIDEGLRLLVQPCWQPWKPADGVTYWQRSIASGANAFWRAKHEMTQAEACFQQALEVARRQQAKSWELRTAMSLSRLWCCRRGET